MKSYAGFDGELQHAHVMHSVALYYKSVAPEAVKNALTLFSALSQVGKAFLATKAWLERTITPLASKIPEEWIPALNDKIKKYGFNPYNPSISEEECAAIFGIPGEEGWFGPQ